MEQEMWDEKREEKRKAEENAVENMIEWAKIQTQFYGNLLRKEYCENLAAGTLAP